jgi:chaperone modulatory protein CbpM
MRATEFLMQSRVDVRALNAWIEAGWLRPLGSDLEPEFSEIDLARVRLISDLRSDLGVNDEGVAIVLDLIDQIHGLRRLVRGLVERNRS